MQIEEMAVEENHQNNQVTIEKNTSVNLMSQSFQHHLKTLEGLIKDLSKRLTYQSASWIEAIFKGYSEILMDVQLPNVYKEEHGRLIADLKEIEIEFLKLKFARSVNKKDKIIEVIKERLEMQIEQLVILLKRV